MKPLRKSLGYLRWQPLFGAVLDAFIANQSTKHPLSASSDGWYTVDKFRILLHDSVREHWVRRTGLAGEDFPLSVDAVARLYMKVRKRNSDEIAAYLEEVEQRSVSLFD